jgi:hypothetical protein
MSFDVEKIVKQPWERYTVPETTVSGEFPSEPWVDDEESDESDGETITLSLDEEYDGAELQFDLAVSVGQVLEVSSSEQLAAQLKDELKDNEQLETVSVEPRSCGEFPGAVQHMRLRETGEILMQWLIVTPEDTIFAGVTFTDERLAAVGESQHHIILGNHAPIPVAGLAWVYKKCWRSCRGQSGSDFSADVATFSHAHDHHPPTHSQ